jgi:GTP cyclohydrolase II
MTPNKLAPYGKTKLPTVHGTLDCYAFVDVIEGVKKEALALVAGDIEGKKGVPVRPHSQCMTSEVFGSLKCDCKEQLDFAIDYIVRSGRGMVIYVLEEGRGIGIGEKIRAYALQEQGLDTIDANLALGQEIDGRRFLIESRIIRALGVQSVKLLTNNPDKIRCIGGQGIEIEDTIQIPVRPNPFSYSYLYAKKHLLHHQIGDLSSVHFPDTSNGQY